jgi:hypothetical protein
LSTALASILIALTWLFREFGVVDLDLAITAVVQHLPGDMRGMLPATA